MLKIIEFNLLTHKKLHIDQIGSSMSWYDLKKHNIISSENFTRSLVRIGSIDKLNLKTRSSWTNTHLFCIELPDELLDFYNKNNIQYKKDSDKVYDDFSLLKYESGDFFKYHLDTNLTDYSTDYTHEYTCLIFCPYDKYTGGELIFSHPNKLYETKFNPSIITNDMNWIAIIFSIDMAHEVLPIISGIRYVFKKHLFVKDAEKAKKRRDLQNVVDTLEGDGGFDLGFSKTSDY